MDQIKIGLKYELEVVSAEEHSAISLGSGTLSVFSTPSMIAFMERASMLCVSNFLEDRQTTVGGLVEVKHLKPTGIGKKVVVTSKIIEIEGKRIGFDVQAHVEGELIGKGRHVRFIIHSDPFMKSL